MKPSTRSQAIRPRSYQKCHRRSSGPDRSGISEICSQTDAGFTLVEILIVIAVISILTAMASAGLIRARAAANEAGAIATVRVTFSSQKAYAASCGGGAYATGYPVLGTGVGAGPAFISADLGTSGTPQKAGYQFSIAAGAGSNAGPIDCMGRPTITAFYAAATPLSSWTGNRGFAITANGTLWQLTGLVPPAEPFGPPASPIQ